MKGRLEVHIAINEMLLGFVQSKGAAYAFFVRQYREAMLQSNDLLYLCLIN